MVPTHDRHTTETPPSVGPGGRGRRGGRPV